MAVTARWTDYENKKGYWGPQAQINETIESNKLRLQSMRLPDLSREYLSIALRGVISNATAINSIILATRIVKSRVLAILHSFAAGIYYKKLFSGLVESIFEQYKSRIDPLIASDCGLVLKKLPYVFDRLADGDSEAISQQALNTSRRIIDSIADTLYPPSDSPIVLVGNDNNLGLPHHKNRINAYTAERVESDTRRRRLR